LCFPFTICYSLCCWSRKVKKTWQI